MNVGLLGPVGARVGPAEPDACHLDRRPVQVAGPFGRGHHVSRPAVGDEAAVLLAERIGQVRRGQVVVQAQGPAVHDGGRRGVGVLPAGHGDGPELSLRRPVLVHVAAGDGGEVDGLGEPAEGDLEVGLEALLRVELPRPAGHGTPLGRPGHGERVDDDRGVAVGQRLGRRDGGGGRPAHPAPGGRLPQVVAGAEVGVEGSGVELVGHAGPEHDAVDVLGAQAGVGQRPFDGGGGDLGRRAARRPAVLGLAHPDDGHLSADVVEGDVRAPVVAHGRIMR